MPFFPYFFYDIFEIKIKNPFELVVGYFYILQQCKILHNNNANCNERNQKKKNIYISITKNHDLWKPIVQNSMRIVDPENLGRLSKPTPKIKTNNFHEKWKQLNINQDQHVMCNPWYMNMQTLEMASTRSSL